MSSYSNNHILYGNYGLSNKRIQVRELAILDGSPNALQTIPISRGTGSSVVRNRTEARSIKLAGGTTYTNETQKEDSVLEMTDKVKKIFSKQKRFLRTVPKSKVTVLDDCQSTLNWSNSGDGGALTLDQADFEYGNASLKSTVTVSGGSATYTKNIVSQDLSALANTGNFEFWTYLSDVYNITSLDFRVGRKLTNILVRTDALNNATKWLRVNGLTISTADVNGYFTLTDGTSAFSGLQQTLGVVASGQAFTFSITAKSGTNSTLNVSFQEVNLPFTVQFSTNFALTGTETRYTITGTNNSSNSVGVVLRVGTGAGINEGTLLIKDPQLELGSTATAYQVQSGATGAEAYYSQNITTNYEGLPFENGWNYISVPWGNDIEGLKMTETGVVNDSIIDYTLLKANYLTTAENFTFGLGGLFHVQEDFCRNFLCSLDGGINTEPQWYLTADNIKNDFELTLLNYTGYSQATHSITLFTESAITTLNRTKKVDLHGTLKPLINNNFTLNAVTNLNNLVYTNLSTSESISWTKSWVAGDNLIFDSAVPTVTTNGLAQDFNGKIPSNNLGINYLNMNIIQSSNSVISQLVGSLYETGSEKYVAQSFTPGISGTVTSVTAYVRLYSFDPRQATVNFELRTNNAGVPSTTILATATVTEAVANLGTRDFTATVTFSQAVTSGTLYWICMPTTTGSFRGWYYDGSNVYANGSRATSTAVDGLSAWTASAGTDRKFSVVIEPTPATNIDWSASYKPRYI